jgi:hypothetical protein
MSTWHEENPKKVTNAEIVVTIPSPDKVTAISFPVEKANEGLVQFFPDRKSVIIGCGYQSDNGTREAFMRVKTVVPKIYLSPSVETKGKPQHVRSLLQKAVELDAKAVIVVDSDTATITPWWIKNLGKPLFGDFGFVSPLYLRHRFEETITNTIVYPLTRALYGRRVRQPIGGDFGMSGWLARLCVEDRFWDDRIADYDSDIWITTFAIIQGVPICQSFMGGPKLQKPADPGTESGPLFNQVVGSLFTLIGHYEKWWQTVKWSKPTAIFGFGSAGTASASDLTVNRNTLYNRFTDRGADMVERWKAVLAPEVFSKLTEVSDIPKDRFDFPTQLWAKILFDHAVAFQRYPDQADRLVESLQPLYCGKVLSYVNKVETMSTQQAEEYVEEECLIFEETKPYLLNRWAQ